MLGAPVYGPTGRDHPPNTAGLPRPQHPDISRRAMVRLAPAIYRGVVLSKMICCSGGAAILFTLSLAVRTWIPSVQPADHLISTSTPWEDRQEN